MCYDVWLRVFCPKINHTMVVYKRTNQEQESIILNIKLVEMDLRPVVVFLAVLYLSTTAGMFQLFATFV